MQISWRRGFFRAWIAFALIWVGVAGWLVYDSIKPNVFDQFDKEAATDARLIEEFNAHPTDHSRMSNETLMALYRQAMRETAPVNQPPPGYVLDKPVTE